MHIDHTDNTLWLPIITNSHDTSGTSINEISVGTVATLVDHASHPSEKILTKQIPTYNGPENPRILFVDCRYPYEYEAGHINHSENIYQVDNLIHRLFANTKDTFDIIVLWCEFSSRRAPKAWRTIREMDRTINFVNYPAMHYPQMYVMQGGYSQFYSAFSSKCTPSGYLHQYHQNYVDQDQLYRTLRKASETRASRVIGDPSLLQNWNQFIQDEERFTSARDREMSDDGVFSDISPELSRSTFPSRRCLIVPPTVAEPRRMVSFGSHALTRSLGQLPLERPDEDSDLKQHTHLPQESHFFPARTTGRCDLEQFSGDCSNRRFVIDGRASPQCYQNVHPISSGNSETSSPSSPVRTPRSLTPCQPLSQQTSRAVTPTQHMSFINDCDFSELEMGLSGLVGTTSSDYSDFCELDGDNLRLLTPFAVDNTSNQLIDLTSEMDKKCKGTNGLEEEEELGARERERELEEYGGFPTEEATTSSCYSEPPSHRNSMSSQFETDFEEPSESEWLNNCSIPIENPTWNRRGERQMPATSNLSKHQETFDVNELSMLADIPLDSILSEDGLMDTG